MISKIIPYGRQFIEEDDIKAVASVLRSDFLTQGPKVLEFENALKQSFRSDYAIVQNSATASLYVSYKSLGIGNNDIVWTVPNTFVATSNAALLAGAKVDFIDINSDTYCMDLSDLENKLYLAKKESRLPKVVTPVHFAGQPCDMKSIRELSNEYGFKVLEDAAHAVGAIYDENFVGCCQYSDATVFSFHPVKIITTGEGGAVLTKNENIAKSVRLLTSHGVTRDQTLYEEASGEPWKYEQINLSHNFRMPDVLAALGESQLKRLAANNKRRKMIAHRYQDELHNLPLKWQKNIQDAESAWHLFVIQVQNSDVRRKIFDYLRNEGIGVNVHYIPVHHQPYYQRLGFTKEICPNSLSYYETCLSLPMFHSMSDVEQEIIISKIKKFFIKNGI